MPIQLRDGLCKALHNLLDVQRLGQLSLVIASEGCLLESYLDIEVHSGTDLNNQNTPDCTSVENYM